jgi:hypothetical protein
MVPGRSQQTILGLNTVHRRRTGRRRSEHGMDTKTPADLRPHVLTGVDLADQPESVDRPHPHVHLDRSRSWPDDISSTQAASRRRTSSNQAAPADMQRQETPRSEALSQRCCWSTDGRACAPTTAAHCRDVRCGPSGIAAGVEDGMAARRQWSDLSERTRRLLIAAAVAEAILKVAALIDIKQRPASQIRGPKWLWATVVAVISSAGVVPISYFVFGRRQPRSHPGPPNLLRNASDAAGVTDPLSALRSQGPGREGTPKSGGPQRRSCATGGWHNPVALLVAGRTVCRFSCRTVGEHDAAWVIRHIPVNRAWVPKSHPAIGESAPGAPTNRARSIEPDQTALGG